MELNGKILLMFGDYHDNTKECKIYRDGDKSISDIFDLFGKYSPVCSDLFIEGYSLVQGYNNRYNIYDVENPQKTMNIPDVMLGNILKKYWNCLGINKKQCHFGNLRIHNTDFRRNPNDKYNLFDLPFVNNKHAYSNLIVGLLNGNMDSVAKSMNIIHGVDKYKFFDILSESNYLKVSKQYDNIPNSLELRHEFTRKYFDEIYNFSLMNKYSKIYLNRVRSYITDIYALPRIVKAIYSYNDSGIVMVYSGATHILRYRDILSKVYRAKIITKTDDPDDLRIAVERKASENDFNELLKILDENAPIRSCIEINANMMAIIINSLIPIFKRQSICKLKNT
jgi:hypothetical protein